jgi:ribosomal protein L16 Arg81 hydroxylase
MIDVPMKQVFKNSSHHDVTVRVFILGEPSMHKVMSPGDILSIPDIPGDYLIELVA